ncbi:hypothetical protein T459_17774 [Capsicum annuum]|uniref:Uncharacterized protein n=1 Tax=Capsicum annuum TaxID=4072 RepID=A0A2G2ZCJ6_CAPAN|nr:hypothetical protein T459_17774 [Capsicum annuum]
MPARNPADKVHYIVQGLATYPFSDFGTGRSQNGDYRCPEQPKKKRLLQQQSSYEAAVLCWNLSYEMSGVMRNVGTSLYLWKELLLYRPAVCLVPDRLKAWVTWKVIKFPSSLSSGWKPAHVQSPGRNRKSSYDRGILLLDGCPSFSRKKIENAELANAESN